MISSVYCIAKVHVQDRLYRSVGPGSLELSAAVDCVSPFLQPFSLTLALPFRPSLAVFLFISLSFSICLCLCLARIAYHGSCWCWCWCGGPNSHHRVWQAVQNRPALCRAKVHRRRCVSFVTGGSLALKQALECYDS